MSPFSKKPLAIATAIVLCLSLALAGCGGLAGGGGDGERDDEALVLEGTVWEATQVTVGGERMSIEEYGEREGHDIAFYLEFESDDEANWYVAYDGAVNDDASATLDYELDDGELTFGDYQGVELDVTSLKPSKLKIELTNDGESVTLTFRPTDMEPGDVEELLLSSGTDEPMPTPATGDADPTAADIPEEELLAIANGDVLDCYNFAMYLAAGAVFEIDWTVSDSTGQYRLVTDGRIHSLADIEYEWHTHFASSSVMPDVMTSAFKEEDGAVWSSCMGVGDNFTTIELYTVVSRDSTSAVLSGTRWFEYGDSDQQDGERENGGTITCTYVCEGDSWRCQDISLDGEPWGFVSF